MLRRIETKSDSDVTIHILYQFLVPNLPDKTGDRERSSQSGGKYLCRRHEPYACGARIFDRHPLPRRRRRRRRSKKRKAHKKPAHKHTPPAIQFGVVETSPKWSEWTERQPLPVNIPSALFDEIARANDTGMRANRTIGDSGRCPRSAEGDNERPHPRTEGVDLKEIFLHDAAHEAMIHYKYTEMLSSPKEMIKKAFDSRKKPDKSHLRTPATTPEVEFVDEHIDQLVNPHHAQTDINDWPGATNAQRAHRQNLRTKRCMSHYSQLEANALAELHHAETELEGVEPADSNGRNVALRKVSDAKTHLARVIRAGLIEADAEYIKWVALDSLEPNTVEVPLTPNHLASERLLASHIGDVVMSQCEKHLGDSGVQMGTQALQRALGTKRKVQFADEGPPIAEPAAVCELPPGVQALLDSGSTTVFAKRLTEDAHERLVLSDMYVSPPSRRV
ncbi:MAG: uncharacterized protein KVP18_000041 [Porospora cf. gigantea A]|uniref:uncharacterized protein n=1 Tax=Porospora cf. gigantea A TaxID=2853593 RepID=UPI00355A4EF1|nr:MAG: hypothetical protein KVP18_000041 [Porospora cf. gigantea A]